MLRQALLSLCLFIMAAVMGCTRDIRDPSTHGAGVHPKAGESASEARAPEALKEGQGPRVNGHLSVRYVKQHLKPGLEAEQVLQHFGEGYKWVVHPEGGTRMWRYDFAEPSYQFQAQGDTIGTGIAQADLDGLSKGMIQMQLFVGWDGDDKQTAYSELYYTVEQQGKHQVHLFTVYPDGSTTDQEIPKI